MPMGGTSLAAWIGLLPAIQTQPRLSVGGGGLRLASQDQALFLNDIIRGLATAHGSTHIVYQSYTILHRYRRPSRI